MASASWPSHPSQPESTPVDQPFKNRTQHKTTAQFHNPLTALILVSLWMATVGNVPLWRELAAVTAQSGLAQGRALLFGVAFSLLIACCTAALLSLLNWGRFFKVVAVFFLLITASNSYFMLSYGVVIDTPMLQNVMQTDVKESLDLLNWRLPALVVALVLPPLWWLMRKPMRPASAVRQVVRNLLFSAASLLAAVLCLLLVFQDFSSTMRNHTKMRYMINPLNSVYAAGNLVAHARQKPDGPVQPVGLDAHLGASYSQQNKPPLLLLVLGETGRSGNFGLNGYDRPTTPELSKRTDLATARNAWSCGTSTAASVPCMFSPLSRSNFINSKQDTEGLLDIAQRAGLAVLWLDNQAGCKGVCERVPNASTTDLKDPQFCSGGECGDAIMLKNIEQRIESLPPEKVAKGVLLVMHQMGSHGPAYYKRSLPSDKHFMPECTSNALQECSKAQVVSAYDNTIVATDRLLSLSIQWLSNQSGKFQTSMMYVADHGESLGENNIYLHGLPYALAPDVQKHVPWITWLSPAMQQRSAVSTTCLQHDVGDQHITHDNYFHSVLGLMNIETTLYQPALDIFSNCRAQGAHTAALATPKAATAPTAQAARK